MALVICADERRVLILLGQHRVAPLHEALVVLVAVAVAGHRVSADDAGGALAVQLHVATAADPL